MDNSYETRKSHGASTPSFIGNIESVLRPEFIEDVTKAGKTDVLPFRGKLNLPSREQVIKLVLFTKQLPGNYHKSKTVIAQLVCDQILIYWNMANFATLTKQNVCNKIIKEWNEYQNINKNKRETERELNVKRTYKDNLTVSLLLNLVLTIFMVNH